MSDAPDLRPARPVRRRSSSNGEVATAPPAVEALVRDGLAAVAHRQEELAELLESAIDHLVAIERRLDALEVAAAAPPAKRTQAKASPARKATRTAKKAAPPKD